MAKTELEEAGLETEGMVDSTAKLRSEIMALTGVDIMDGANQFKSTYKIMDELAQKWEDLSDIQQATVTELIAGKRQGNIVSSLMTNFDTARDALETSLNSAGSAMQEHEKWQQSLEARINSLKASWQALSQSFMDSNFLHGALEAVINLVDGITKLIDTFGTLPTLVGVVAAGFSAFKNQGLFKFDKDIQSIKLLGTQLTGLKGKFTQIQTAIDRYNSLSSKSASFQEKYNKSMANSSTSMGKYLRGLNGAKATFSGYIGSLVGATVKTIALEAVTIALNAAITMGISFAIQGLITLFDKWYVSASELAEEVDELTSKFEEEHNALQKLKSDYDTSNESSMISKYSKLSKGVDGLGRNISLTADEYSEYQSIVNKIAEQIPSLVSGYDSQGNALLSCKDNVEALTQAYEDMISAQNRAILNNAGKIGEDFANKVKENESTGFWGTDLSESVIEQMERDLNNVLSDGELKDYYYGVTNGVSDAKAIEKALENAGLAEFDKFSWDYLFNYEETIAKAFEKAAKMNPKRVRAIINEFRAGLEADVAEMKNIAQATLSDAFDLSDSKYYDMSDTMQSVAKNIVSGFDYEFYKQYKDNPLGVQTYINNMLDQLKSMSDMEGAAIESSFDLQTKFNGGEISYGDYVDGLVSTGETINQLISSGKLDKEIGSQIKLSIGLNEDGLVDEYQRLRNRLADSSKFDISEPQYESFIEGLSADELSVVWDVIPRLEKTSYKETIKDIKAALEREMMLQGLTFNLNLETESVGIEALNTALAESVSASGLSSESILALKGRYAELEAQGYDLSSMFEETSHGVHLNREEYNKLEKAYASQKLTKINGQLDEMQRTYDQLGEDIKNCTDPVEKSKLFSDRQLLAQRISEAATLTSQYQGLTSAYNDWLAAEESGSERSMYEQVIEGFENIGDEISRGWYDDGTIKFLELLTGETDLAGKSASELKKIWKGLDDNIKNTSYSVKDFFTVDEDGNSTSTGVYNFLRALQELESSSTKSSVLNKAFKDIENIEELVTVKDGKITEFNFDVVGGEKAVADALGISEELVQIIMRAADDAGFVVNMDGAYQQLADLQNEAKAAANTLRELGLTDYEFDFNTSSVENLNKQLNEAHKILDNEKFWNKDGTFNFDADGATQAMTIVSTLQAKLDTLKQEQYGIGLTVEDEELEEPLTNLQEYGRKIATLNQLKLNPKTNAEEIEKLNSELDGIAKEFAELPDETKVEIGLVGANGQAFTEEYFNKLSRNRKISLGFVDENGNPIDNYIDAVQKKIESGEIEIPTVLDIQANMDKNIETLADLALLNSGLLSEDEEAVIRKKYKVELEDETDTKKNRETIDRGIKRVTADGDEEPTTIDKKFVLNTNIIEQNADKLGLTDLISGYDELTQTVIVEYITKNEEEFNKLTDEDKKVVVEFIANGDSLEEYTPEQKQAIVEYLTDSEDPDNWTPEQKEAVAKFKKDSAEVDDYTPAQKEAIAKFIKDSIEPDTYTPPNPEGVVTFYKDTSNVDGYDPPNFTRYVTYYAKQGITTGAKAGAKALQNRFGVSEVNGAANVNGTTGRAFKQGSWGTKSSGTALVGELGREVLVRDGRYYTIGDNGAEFIRYKQGDIIFNHVQSEELFRNGRVTSGGGRAQAFANGTALLQGAAFVQSGGVGGGEEPDPNDKNSSDKFEEVIDWIETVLDRADRLIDKYEKQANNVYKTWNARDAALDKQIGAIENAISKQTQSKAYYDGELDAFDWGTYGDGYESKIKDGTIAMQKITDENLADKIKEYTDLYEKYLDADEKLIQLEEDRLATYEDHFNQVQEKYDGILQGFDHTETMLNEYINQSEAKGHLVSKNYYTALISNEKSRISQLKQEQSALIAARNEAEANGIDKNSQAWMDMCADIDEVTQAIEASTTSLIEYNNAIRDIDWEVFDLIQERISDITEEADFLIELMSNDKLFDDNGNLTNEGLSTMGLHAQNYNSYMYAADDYQSEINKLDKQLKSDPYDQELINRRRELLELQRESILAAEEEKQSIKDLISEGYDKQLEALQDRIDLYNESIESAKDLYDYERNIAKQVQNISSLEKQLKAYEGFDDEETRSTVQKLKVELSEAKSDLEETQYDKYIQDSQKMLDNLYESYSEVLNTRLDDTNGLLQGIINEVNDEASTIKTTLETATANVGAQLSTAMSSIWNSEGTGYKVIAQYGDNFQLQQSTTNTTLNNIKSDVNAMAKKLGVEAQEKVEEPKTQPAAEADPTKNNNNKNNNNNNNNGNNNKTTEKSEKDYYGVALAIWNGNYGWGTGATRKKKLKEKGFDPDKVQSIVNKLGKDGYVPSGAWQGKYYGIKSLPPYHYNKFALGAKDIDETQLAWTQERGREFIVRPSDGAILTPIAKGDSVLTSAASKNIWDMANSPAEFIKDNLSFGATNVPNNSNVQNVYHQNLDKIVISLPNVHNYQEFMSEMQKDKNFKRLVTSMTIDQIAGKSSLAVNKAIR